VLEKIRTEADYFERNADRMRYPKFRRQHLFVGSGVIEAGCKTVIGSRLKQSGMFWTVRGANSIIAMLSSQRPLRGLLGVAAGGLIPTSMSPAHFHGARPFRYFRPSEQCLGQRMDLPGSRAISI